MRATRGDAHGDEDAAGHLLRNFLFGALVGELLFTVFKDQFERAREGTRLADVIRRNTGVGTELSSTPFIVGDAPHEPHRDPPQTKRPAEDIGRLLQNRFSR